ncbi:mitochondrial carrier domain-containing protein [Lineolata rhizophorae]|uniref:Mitochondrial carrier domain-containing protein n=1 Tax=Lineolata rhizophorae TaxID=578093 RepID=A0A6A6P6H3_9PEZI|nr:mitochondrial carrier domain-containing protein [Lineolata rhizophorae]
MTTDEELELGVESQGLKRTLKDLFAGAAGGIAQVLIGQPFDIVKVRLQTTQQYSNAFDCAGKIWKNEGPLAFYKGTLTPLIGIGACVSIQFGGFHYARRAFEARNKEANPSAPPTLSYGQYYLAGAFAGVTNSVLSGPIEHIRIRLQTQPHGAGRLYNGPIDCVRKLSVHEGILRGVFRGEAVTILREAQAYGVWFLTFEYLMNWEAQRSETPRNQISALKVTTYGGIAGEALWIASYPFDVIKSKMQSDGFGPNMRYMTMRDAFTQTWELEGMRGFWKGIGPTLLRAMPVSGGTFAVAEMTLRLIS